VGRRVAVIGGGNTAFDAARTARRAGAEVVVLYRRSQDEMPATESEVNEALAEGVRIEYLVAPLRLDRVDGRPLVLTSSRMELAEPDRSGRRGPVRIPGSNFALDVDTVIAAVSHEPDWGGLEAVDHAGMFWAEADMIGDGLWAGGDVLGLGIAGHAIHEGRRAAETVHTHLCGLPPPPSDERRPAGPADILFELFPRLRRAEPGRLLAAEALGRPEAEVHLGLGEEEFLTEASRCLSCGSCFGCELCAMYCTLTCFHRVDEPEPGAYYALSLDRCVECGKCIEVCPCGYLEVG
jgi:NADPH-dependent glutamate synthase beta subunit-like oxidoreductase